MMNIESSKSESSKDTTTKTQEDSKANSIFSFLDNNSKKEGSSKVSELFKDSSSSNAPMDKSAVPSSKTFFDDDKSTPFIKPEKMDKASLSGQKESWFGLDKTSTLWIKILLVVILLGFLGVNLLFYLGYSFKKIWGVIKRFFESIIQLFNGGVHHDKDLEDHKEDEEEEKKNKPPPKTMNDLEDQIEDPDLRPKEDDKPETVEPAPDATKIHTSGKSGYCNVGSWKGIRSCVKVSHHNDCISGDIFPTKEICINPNLRT